MEENNLTKQNVIDIILEDLENGGAIMEKLQKRFDPWNSIGLIWVDGLHGPCHVNIFSKDHKVISEE